MNTDYEKEVAEKARLRTIAAKKLVHSIMRQYYNQCVTGRVHEQIDFAKANAALEAAKVAYKEDNDALGWGGYSHYEAEVQRIIKRQEAAGQRELDAEEALKIVIERFIEESV